MSAIVRVERDEQVAVVVIDNPPINAGSQEVRAGLLEAIRQIDDAPDVRAAVLIGAGTTFIAGSDLREFGKPIPEPSLPSVIEAIEASAKPFVAALHGAALGGGFELALGCDARVAAPGTAVGLPEVTLGIIPGAGGTQRVPRLTGVPRAITMICAGERVPADAALALGLVDKVVDGDLRRAAVLHAAGLEAHKHRVRDLPVPAADEAAVAKASQAALKAGKYRPAVQAAIQAISAAARLPFEEALAEERASFQALRVSREARALRHQFFAEREAGKIAGLQGVTARASDTIGVVGAGTMGTGIAIAALDAGCRVLLLEADEAALARGAERLRAYYKGRVQAGKLEELEADKREARLQVTLDWNQLAAADLIIEAVFEDLAVKQEVFRRLDAVARKGAVLASNTSYIDLDAIAAVTGRPDDVVGLHFFSPAQVMRLLEIVRGRATATEVLATALQFAKRLRKIPVLSGNAFGFIGNRIYAAYRKQCEFLLEEGATPAQVDAALEGFGFAMGPFAVADMSGLDIAWRMRQSLAATRNPQDRYVTIPDRLCEAGRLGQKAGAGYYRYAAPGSRREEDPTVEAVLDEARAAKEITARSLGEEEITRRAVLAMVNEAALLLHDGVAQRAGDVDVVLVNGYGFPKWEGGPVFWARERGLNAVKEDLAWLAQRSGPGWTQSDPAPLFGT